MAGVSVLVPWRSDGGPRAEIWAWVSGWWAARFPDWQVVSGDSPAGGPWVKALAVSDAASRADGDVWVVADADVVCDPAAVARAVDLVRAGAPWAIPARMLARLTPEATARVLAGDPLEAVGRRDYCIERSRHRTAGGMTVVRREVFELVPMDPRFVGWDPEDWAWEYALSTTCGAPHRPGMTDPVGDMVHLWHPPAPDCRKHRGGFGSAEGRALYRRYKQAAGHRGLMTRLLAEIGGPS